MANVFLVTVKNPDYNGKVYGIQFNKGKAVVSDEVVDKSIGLTAAEIAERMETEFGYTVKPMSEPKARKRGESEDIS